MYAKLQSKFNVFHTLDINLRLKVLEMFKYKMLINNVQKQSLESCANFWKLSPISKIVAYIGEYFSTKMSEIICELGELIFAGHV